MESSTWLQEFLESVVTPLTVLAGLLGNSLSIVVLNSKEIQLRKSFTRILIALAFFDIVFIASSALIFSLSALSSWYHTVVYPWVVPVLLPIAQISMTASVYTTVVTCFDRYIAICRPALLGCCGRSEDTTSWALIAGTFVFSILYNFSRFFEYHTLLISKEEEVAAAEAPPDAVILGEGENGTLLLNVSNYEVRATPLRMDSAYIQYYILTANFVVMGILPCVIMVIFNVLVVRAVDEANKRRARISKRQQRNITVTSMLVTVVLVFLACHSVKLIISVYEVYSIVFGADTDDAAVVVTAVTDAATTASTNFIFPTEATVFNFSAALGGSGNGGIRSTLFPFPVTNRGFNLSSPTLAAFLNLTRSRPPPPFDVSQLLRLNSTTMFTPAFMEGATTTPEAAAAAAPSPPVWYGYLTAISHWLLILNSSCNIAIYLHKDPKFKAVAKNMLLRALRMEGQEGPGSPDGMDSVDGNAANTVAPNHTAVTTAPPGNQQHRMSLLGKNRPFLNGKAKDDVGRRVTCVVHEEEETKFIDTKNNGKVANGRCAKDNNNENNAHQEEEDKVDLVAQAGPDGKVTSNTASPTK